MKISQLLSREEVTLSFEIFPPKSEQNLPSVLRAANAIASLSPDFMSVTYGAAGTTRRYTIEVASQIHHVYGVPLLPHLTCVSVDREGADSMLASIKAANVDNVMVLRGDKPLDGKAETFFSYAVDLIRYVKSHSDLCVGGACYPEGHPESISKEKDIDFLKQKVDAGCDFLTTQMFLDNNVFYNFLYRVRARGVQVPILAGIMPITSARQLRHGTALSGMNVPERFRAIVDHFGDSPVAMKQAGVIYAAEQIVDLIANGVRHIHVYSMNKPDVAAGIYSLVKGLLGKRPETQAGVSPDVGVF